MHSDVNVTYRDRGSNVETFKHLEIFGEIKLSCFQK